MNYIKAFLRQWGCWLFRSGEDQGLIFQQNHLSAWACAVSSVLTAILFFSRVPFIDDAYITFRYAQRLSELGSLSWNNGVQPIMGTTTVLWTLILSGFHTLGFDIEDAALGVTTLLIATLLYQLLVVAERIFHGVAVNLSKANSAALVTLISLHAPVRVSLFSGMETALYCLLVVRGLLLFGKSPALGGLYAGLATLTRPDGIVLLAVGLISYRKKWLTTLIVFTVSTLPWFAYSLVTFGEVFPDSVVAKQILYPSPWLTNFLMLFEAHSQNLVQGAIFYLAGSGIFAAWFIPLLQPFVIWLVLYASGIVVSGIKPLFFWYFAPTWLFGAFTGGLAGACFLVTRRKTTPRTLSAVFVAGACIVAVHSLRYDLGQQSFFLRESVYRKIVSSFRDRIAPSDTILVGETGIIGYGFPKNMVIDSAGLVSHEVRPILQAARASASPALRTRELATIPGWSRELIEQFTPSWIIAARARFDLINLEEDPWFTAHYERSALYIPQHLGGIGVYRRR
jgi:hypothetical protein